MFMPFVFLTIIGIVSYVLPILLNDVDSYIRGSSQIMVLIGYLVIVAIFIPIYEFAPLKSIRGADLYYSLPLDKKRLYLQFYLKGLIEIISSYIVVYILGFLGIVVKGYQLDLIYYIPLFFLLLVGVSLYYTFNVFIFSKANKTIDGIIFIILYMILPLLLYLLYAKISLELFKADVSFMSLDAVMPTGMISFPGDFFALLIEKRSYNNYFDSSWGFIVMWYVISIGVGALMLFYPKAHKPEKVQSKSDSWFGYRVLIPLFLFTMTVTLTELSDYIGVYLILVFSFLLIAYIGYVIYERKFKISIKSLLVLLTTTLLGILVAGILSM
jgi:hypothetical protein